MNLKKLIWIKYFFIQHSCIDLFQVEMCIWQNK